MAGYLIKAKLIILLLLQTQNSKKSYAVLGSALSQRLQTPEIRDELSMAKVKSSVEFGCVATLFQVPSLDKNTH